MRLKINKHRIIKKQLFLCFISTVLIMFLSYLILGTNLLEKRINKTTVSYISFSNQKTTDILQIVDLKKQSDNNGKSINNKQTLKLNITSENKSNYEIVIYPLSNSIENKYIKYYLKNDKESITDTLENKKESSDGGIIIYQGKAKEEDIILKMWISKKYNKKVYETAYEVKIKPR